MAISNDTISVTVVSDILCPWCYIGFRELENAIARFKALHPSHQVRIEYKPFLLDPKLNCKQPVKRVSPLFGGPLEQDRLTQLVERILWHEVPSRALRSDPKGYRSSWRGVGDQLVSAPLILHSAPF